MALSTTTCDILKICKPLLEENKNAIGATFYRKLFSEHPGLRNTFNMSHQRPPAEGEPPLTGAQQLALGNALVAYCANCDQLDKLGPFVERVANKHVSFNVQPEQVDTYITYEGSPRGAASGLSRCNFFRLQTPLLNLFLVQMG